VSRHHLDLEYEGSVWVLTDRSSTGTWIGGQKLTRVSLPAKHEFHLSSPDGPVLRCESVQAAPVLTPVVPPPIIATPPPVLVPPPIIATPPPVLGPLPIAVTPPIAEPSPLGSPIGGEGGWAGPFPNVEPFDESRTVALNDRALRVRADGAVELLFAPGTEVVVGRDPECQVVIDDQLVSRRHARFHHDGRQWTVEDLGSTRGTYIDGRRIRQPTPASGAFSVDLGAVDGGARLGVVTAGTHKKPKSRLPVVLSLAALILATGAIAVGVAVANREQLPNPAKLVASVPLVVGSGNEAFCSGSASVVGAGLVLTNLHVVNISLKECGVPPQIVAGNSEARAEEEFRETELVAYDEVLDLAVLRVKGPFDQPSVNIGNSSEVKTGDKIRVLGYPSAAGAITLTVTDGIVSGTTTDAFDNSFIKTDTAIAGGNSGGAAFSTDGELIGIPTSVTSIRCEKGECDGASFGFIRPIDEAKELIKRAKVAEEPIPWDQVPDAKDGP